MTETDAVPLSVIAYEHSQGEVATVVRESLRIISPFYLRLIRKQRWADRDFERFREYTAARSLLYALEDVRLFGR